MSTVTETCPPLEDIAAFLDGKLTEGERARVVAHLADCESCYAVFAGAARFQLEEDEDKEESTVAEAAAVEDPVVVPFPKRAIPKWALPLAAALILGSTTIPLYLHFSRMPEMLSAELVDAAALKNLPASSLWADDKRGGADATVLDPSPFEFLLGVHQVDLRLMLARNDRGEALNVLSRINGHMKHLLVDEEAKFYVRALEEIDRGKPPGELAGEAERVEADLTEYYKDLPHLAFGKWTEAGRLSALAGDPGFFEDGDNRRFPGWLLRTEEEHLDEGVVQTLKRIREVLDRGDPAELPYPALAQQFERILDHYQREADAASGP